MGSAGVLLDGHMFADFPALPPVHADGCWYLQEPFPMLTCLQVFLHRHQCMQRAYGICRSLSQCSHENFLQDFCAVTSVCRETTGLCIYFAAFASP